MKGKERKPFGQRLFEARTYAKLKQEELAKIVGMSQGTLAEAEWDRDGSRFTAQLAAACGVRAEWLASEDGPMLAATVWPFRRVTLSRVLALSDTDRDFVEGELNAVIRQCEQMTASVVGTITPTASQALSSHRNTDKKPSPTEKTLATQQVGTGSSSGSRGSGKVPKSRSRGGPGRAA